MDLEKVKAQLSDPQEIEVAEQFEKILEKNGIAKDNWHDQTTPSKPAEGVKFDDDDNTAAFLKAADESPDDEEDGEDDEEDKPKKEAAAGGGWQQHFKAGSQHLSACHKSLDDGPAKDHCMKAMKCFGKMAKAFGTQKAATPVSKSLRPGPARGLTWDENSNGEFVTVTDLEKVCVMFTNQIKKAFHQIAEVKEYVGTIPVPKLRPAMPVNRDDEQSNTLTATRNSFGR